MQGLLKHQVYFTRNTPLDVVMTLWTWAADPVTAARVAYEYGAIEAWLGTTWRGTAQSNYKAERITSWDFGATPPARQPPGAPFAPKVGTLNQGTTPFWMGPVVALRTQPVGSLIRNRENGRLYHTGPMTNQSTSAGTIVAADVTALKAAYGALRDVLDPVADPLSGTWSVAMFRHPTHLPLPKVLPIDHVLVAPRLSVMRSRAPKQGAYAIGA